MIKTKHLIIIILILLLSLGFLFNRYQNLNETINRQNSNIEALNDSVTTYRTKNGTLVHEKKSLISTNSELKILNNELYTEKQKLEKELNITSNAYQRLKINGYVITKYDTIEIDRDIIDSNTIRFTLTSEKTDSIVTNNVNVLLDIFCFGDSSSIINSNIKSEFYVKGLKLNIITGYRRRGLFKRDKKYISSVSTNDERFVINDIDSWINPDEKPKPYINIKPGLLVGGIFNPFTKDIGLGIGIGIIFSLEK